MILPQSSFLIKGNAMFLFHSFMFQSPNLRIHSLNTRNSHAIYKLILWVLYSKYIQSLSPSSRLIATIRVKATIISRMSYYKHPPDWFPCTCPSPIIYIIFPLHSHHSTIPKLSKSSYVTQGTNPSDSFSNCWALTCIPPTHPNSYVEFLSPNTSKGDCMGDRIFKEVIQAKCYMGKP